MRTKKKRSENKTEKAKVGQCTVCMEEIRRERGNKRSRDRKDTARWSSKQRCNRIKWKREEQ